MPCHPTHIAHSGHHIERAVDGDGHYGQLDVVSQHESSTLEHAHMTRKRTCSFGKYHERHAALQRLACTVVGLAYLAGASFVDEYVVSRLACLAHEGHLTQLTLHHPLEIAAQETVNQEYIEGSLMVGYEHIRLSFLQVFTSLYLHGQQKHTHNELRPPLAGIISPEMTVAQCAADNYHQTCYYGVYSNQRKSYEELINTIYILHILLMFNYYTFMEDYLLCHVMKDTQKLFPTEL